MGLDIGIGFSQNENVFKASEEAAEEARANLDAKRIDLAIVMSTPHYSPQDVHPVIDNSLKQTRIIGGTTLGIILPDGLKRRGVAVILFNSDTVKLKPIHAQHLHLKDLKPAGQSFIRESGDQFGLRDQRFLMFFFDGLLENMSEFIHGVAMENGDFFPVLGGGCSDKLMFSKTYQYHDKEVSQKSASGVVFGGDISLFMSRRHGWKPLGKPRLVKQSRRNIIEKIGSGQAFHLYEEFFQNNLGFLKNDVFGKLNSRYPLGLFLKNKQEYVVQNVMDILEDGSIACQDTVSSNSEVHIMIGNKHSCLQSAEAAAQELKKNLDNRTPSFIFIFESAMRWQVLKQSWSQEFKIVTDILGKKCPVIGMLTYGEIFNPGILNYPGRKYLLNGNIILTAVV
ncbi:MAG: FIST N-terminal domain-containing protein [Candidatus Omnitrophota bacterium]